MNNQPITITSAKATFLGALSGSVKLPKMTTTPSGREYSAMQLAEAVVCDMCNHEAAVYEPVSIDGVRVTGKGAC